MSRTARPPAPVRPGQELSVAREHADCAVLGPGRRYAVWVQGCSLRCSDCISSQWLPFGGGVRVGVDELAGRILASGREGLTLSGGEPFEQPDALVELIDLVRRGRDMSVMSFSGYTLERLRHTGNAGQRELLSRLDILVDGPYLRDRHGDLAWRGSSNQRVHLLGDRHHPGEVPLQGVGLQVEITADAEVLWYGVPPYPGFRQAWERVYAPTAISRPEGDP